MPLKTTLMGPIIAVVLMLSTTAGTLAQQSDSQPVSVELKNTLCAIDIAIESGSFGEWAWNGSAWVNTSTTDYILFHGTLYTPPQATCTVSVSFAGLTDAATNTTISPNNFNAASFTPQNANRRPAGWSQENVSGTAYDFYYQLMTPSPSVPAGTYTGKIDVTVVNTA